MRAGATEPRDGRLAWPLLLAVLAAAVIVRVPYLANATVFFNSDEAVNGLQLKHLLAGREAALHPWDATYYGIVEQLIAVPYVWALGLEPIALKLAAVTGHLLLMVATFLLGRRLFGQAEGLVAAALLAVFSPRAIQWSALATGGSLLIVAWGTLTFLWFDRWRRDLSPWRAWTLGLIAGFGLYLYELYLVYLATLAIAAFAASFAWRAALARPPAERRDAWRSGRRQLGGAVLFLCGLAVGWLPKLLAIAGGEVGGKTPGYGLAAPARIADGIRLLVGRCAPALLGAYPADLADQGAAGAMPPLSLGLGSLLLAGWLAAGLWGLVRNRSEIAAMLRRPPRAPSTEALLALLVPVNALVFVLTGNARDVHSDHYLLPWLTSLPLFAAAMIVRLARRRRLAAAALALLLGGGPLVQTVRWYRSLGVLDQRLRLVRHREAITDVLDYLRQRRLRGGYSSYWVAYKATFLADEEVVIAPLWDWDRYPAYSRLVDTLPAAYVFGYRRSASGERLEDRHAEFVRRLRLAGGPFATRRIANYLVYTSPLDRPLLVALRPLTAPRADVEVLAAPGAARPGAELRLPVRLTNRGGEPWSAAGDGIGIYRVDLSYRWFDRGGQPIVLHDGQRTLLPRDLHPGESVEVEARVVVPADPGEHLLVVSPVQEGVAWFVDVGGGSASRRVEVVAATGSSR